MSEKETSPTINEFLALVNMSPAQLETWLATDDSREVGQKDDGGESIGHRSGRKIIALLQTKRADYSQDDIAHMRHVISYIKRHSAQRPAGDIEETRWRYSLMNWGHDPLKQ